MTQQMNEIDPEFLAKLDEIKKQTQAESKYLKLNSGDKMDLIFTKDVEFQEGEYNGRKTKQVQFTVFDKPTHDPNNPNPKYLKLSRQWSNMIIDMLRSGINELTIQRRGNGQKDTNYIIQPYIAPR